MSLLVASQLAQILFVSDKACFIRSLLLLHRFESILQVRESFIALLSGLLSLPNLEGVTRLAREVQLLFLVGGAKVELGRVVLLIRLDLVCCFAIFESHSLAKAQLNLFVVAECVEDSVGGVLGEIQTHDLSGAFGGDSGGVIVRAADEDYAVGRKSEGRHERFGSAVVMQQGK